ncbi:MAG: zinc-binding protein [Rhodocyclales bacterium]|nr:zinc-binding protein [Rhodocyclales bacterium]
MKVNTLPLVYSCSGCSSAAQLANALALRLTREGLAEMSCVAGVGGGVPALLGRARQPRPKITLDGCALGCARACLEREHIDVTVSVDLSRHGVRKRRDGSLIDPDEAERVWDAVIIPALAAANAGVSA